MDTATPQETPAPLPVNLYDYALAQARASAEARELRTVAKESGLDYSWLSKFALERIPGASYEKVHVLATYYMARAAREAQQSEGQGAQTS